MRYLVISSNEGGSMCMCVLGGGCECRGQRWRFSKGDSYTFTLKTLEAAVYQEDRLR